MESEKGQTHLPQEARGEVVRGQAIEFSQTTQSNAKMCEVLGFSNTLLEVILGVHMPHASFTEAIHVRQVTDTYRRPQRSRSQCGCNTEAGPGQTAQAQHQRNNSNVSKGRSERGAGCLHRSFLAKELWFQGRTLTAVLLALDSLTHRHPQFTRHFSFFK